MGFEHFLQTREGAERLKADRESALAAKEQQLRSRAPDTWKELQEAVRKTAEGKRYKGELFIWRAATTYPASLVLKNVAASFFDRERDSRTYTVLLGGIPGIDAMGALYSPDPEFIDVRYKGLDLWLVGASTAPMRTAGENSAAETICKALVTYFDDYEKTHRSWVAEARSQYPVKNGRSNRRGIGSMQ